MIRSHFGSRVRLHRGRGPRRASPLWDYTLSPRRLAMSAERRSEESPPHLPHAMPPPAASGDPLSLAARRLRGNIRFPAAPFRVEGDGVSLETATGRLRKGRVTIPGRKTLRVTAHEKDGAVDIAFNGVVPTKISRTTNVRGSKDLVLTSGKVHFPSLVEGHTARVLFEKFGGAKARIVASLLLEDGIEDVEALFSQEHAALCRDPWLGLVNASAWEGVSWASGLCLLVGKEKVFEGREALLRIVYFRPKLFSRANSAKSPFFWEWRELEGGGRKLYAITSQTVIARHLIGMKTDASTWYSAPTPGHRSFQDWNSRLQCIATITTLEFLGALPEGIHERAWGAALDGGLEAWVQEEMASAPDDLVISRLGKLPVRSIHSRKELHKATLAKAKEICGNHRWGEMHPMWSSDVLQHTFKRLLEQTVVPPMREVAQKWVKMFSTGELSSIDLFAPPMGAAAWTTPSALGGGGIDDRLALFEELLMTDDETLSSKIVSAINRPGAYSAAETLPVCDAAMGLIVCAWRRELEAVKNDGRGALLKVTQPRREGNQNRVIEIEGREGRLQALLMKLLQETCRHLPCAPCFLGDQTNALTEAIAGVEVGDILYSSDKTGATENVFQPPLRFLLETAERIVTAEMPMLPGVKCAIGCGKIFTGPVTLHQMSGCQQEHALERDALGFLHEHGPEENYATRWEQVQDERSKDVGKIKPWTLQPRFLTDGKINAPTIRILCRGVVEVLNASSFQNPPLAEISEWLEEVFIAIGTDEDAHVIAQAGMGTGKTMLLPVPAERVFGPVFGSEPMFILAECAQQRVRAMRMNVALYVSMNRDAVGKLVYFSEDSEDTFKCGEDVGLIIGGLCQEESAEQRSKRILFGTEFFGASSQRSRIVDEPHNLSDAIADRRFRSVRWAE